MVRAGGRRGRVLRGVDAWPWEPPERRGGEGEASRGLHPEVTVTLKTAPPPAGRLPWAPSWTPGKLVIRRGHGWDSG